MHITYDLPVAIDDIIEAKQRLAGRIYKTGMPRSNYFSERCKGEIFLKFENMQVTVTDTCKTDRWIIYV